MAAPEPPRKRCCNRSTTALAYGPLTKHSILSNGGWCDGSIGEAWIHTDHTSGFAVVGDGVLILSDTLSNCIRRVREGEVETLAGSGAVGLMDGIGQAAEFNHPAQVAICLDGVLVADSRNKAVRRVTMEGAVTTVARLWWNVHVNVLAAGPDGTLYIGTSLADKTDNTCIVKVSPDGSTGILAGHLEESGWVDGGSDVARFGNIASIAICKNDTIIVGDMGNSCVCSVTPDGTVATFRMVAVIASPKLGGVAALRAQVDGTLFIADHIHGRVVKAIADTGSDNTTLRIIAESPVYCPQDLFLDERTSKLYMMVPFRDSIGRGSIAVYVVNLAPVKVASWRAALRSPDLADVTFLVCGERFYAARHTLAAHSDYFRSMFTQPMQESSAQEISVEETSPEAFEALLVYIYSEHVLSLPPMQTIELAGLADLHTLQELADECYAAVLTSLTPDNVATALLSAHRRRLAALVKGCRSYLVDHAAAVANAGGLDSLQAAPEIAVTVMKDLALSRT